MSPSPFVLFFEPTFINGDYTVTPSELSLNLPQI